MGFMDKIKNMFTEEVEEEPIKKDVVQVEIPSPIKEEIKEVKKESVVSNISDSNFIKKEEKKNTPIFFDDDDFSVLESKIEKESVKAKTPYNLKPEKKEEKKVFKPTPIISPVYGVLDKNYHKEDITDRKSSNINYYASKEDVTIDDIRAKAYGTLEDDLENNMFSDSSVFFEEEKKKEDFIEDINLNDVYEKEEITYKREKKIPSRLDRKKDVNESFDNMVAEEMNNNYESDNSINESDLFNLIDSMYEKGDNE